MYLVEKSSQGGSRSDVLKLRRGGLRLRTIGRMAEIATTIASAVEEQGAATQEISRNVQEAAQSTGQVSANMATCSAAPARRDRPRPRC
jgi:hypothetical protein